MRLRVLVSLRHCSWVQPAKAPYDFLNASAGVHRLQPCTVFKGSWSDPAEVGWEINHFQPCWEAAFWDDPIRVSWVIFGPFQGNCPQGTAFLKSSDIEPRLRC